MSIPLDAREMPFNCAALPAPMSLQRAPLDADEPTSGSYLVWRVLGFGGRPNPLVFARVSSIASRTGQALFRTSAGDKLGHQLAAPLRLQTYVDDPMATCCGDKVAVGRAIDMLVLWWLVLGVPLSWRKGALSWDSHCWIGVVYRNAPACSVIMSLPPTFLQELLQLLGPFCRDHGTRPLKEAVQLTGKAGRVAYIVPAATPWVQGLYGALAAAQKAAQSSVREAPPGRCCVRRFCRTAAWLRALVAGDSAAPIPLERTVSPQKPLKARLSAEVIEFDASPWGGGGARRRGTEYVEWFALRWTSTHVGRSGATIGTSASQSFWEFFTLLVVLMVWGSTCPGQALQIQGDNTSALQQALSMRGRGAMLAISRELSWRQARYKWDFAVAHLPTEHNGIADALSRQWGDECKAFPAALRGVPEVAAPDFSNLWAAEVDL